MARVSCVPLITEARVNENAAARGEELLAGGLALKDKYELIGDVRGKGLMFCIELVADRATKAPAGKDVVAAVFEAAYEAGVMVRISGNNLICSPPLVITAQDVTLMLDAIETGLKAGTAVM